MLKASEGYEVNHVTRSRKSDPIVHKWIEDNESKLRETVSKSDPIIFDKSDAKILNKSVLVTPLTSLCNALTVKFPKAPAYSPDAGIVARKDGKIASGGVKHTRRVGSEDKEYSIHALTPKRSNAKSESSDSTAKAKDTAKAGANKSRRRANRKK